MALSVTNACPLECRHCISNSGPSGFHPPLTFVDRVLTFFSCNPFNTRRVSLTGGEPFYDIEMIAALICGLRKLGIDIVAVTSGFWAKSPESALRILQRVQGLTCITLSHDLFHEEYLPVAYLQNAYEAGKELGIEIRIRLVRGFPPLAEENRLQKQILSFASESCVEYQRLIKYGRAESNAIEHASHSPTHIDMCPSTGPHIAANGDFTPCCNSIMAIDKAHPLRLGNIHIDEPDAIYENFLTNQLLLSLKILGVKYFKEKELPILKNADDQSGICDVCYRVCNEAQVWDRVKAEICSDHGSARLYAMAVNYFGFSEFESIFQKTVDRLVRAESKSPISMV